MTRCLAKSAELLKGPCVLVDNGMHKCAANMYVLALQEIGKAQLVREAYESGDARPTIKPFGTTAQKSSER
jgi:hypothetical protein